ncbi:MAG TPA: helix-turn-helix domain-containing protein [Acetobacteraceae bacterium]|nr:helix-turn-helix domain-containing protein [Acetobacteraceae bacterium]
MTTKSLRDLREEMRSVARGEREPAPLPASAMLSTLSSPGNLDLLRIISQERPASVSQLAERTGRAQSNVSRSLQVLARYGLIRLERDGKEVRPVPLARSVDVDLAAGTYRTLAAPAARRRHAMRVVGDAQ